MKQLILQLGMPVFLAANGAASQSPTSMIANERAYNISLVCYVVAVDGGNEADHVKALDGVRKMARALRYDNSRMADDIGKMTTVLGARTRSDPQAITRNREGCRKLGLVS